MVYEKAAPLPAAYDFHETLSFEPLAVIVRLGAPFALRQVRRLDAFDNKRLRMQPGFRAQPSRKRGIWWERQLGVAVCRLRVEPLTTQSEFLVGTDLAVPVVRAV